MKCHVHNDLDAVSTCASCGKGLCVECTKQFERPSCVSCARAVNKKAMIVSSVPLIITGAVAVFGFILGTSSGDPLRTMWIILGIYWGWAYVKPMLFATIFGTIAWRGTGFVLGGMLIMLAICLGMIIGPFLFAKNIFDFWVSKKASDSVAKSM